MTLLSAAALTMGSCTEEYEYDPAGAVAGAQVYFSSELETIDPAGVVALVAERPDGLPCEPQIIFPSSNRVNSVVVRPPLVRLLPEPQPQESEP